MDQKMKTVSAPNVTRKRKASRPKQKGKAQGASEVLVAGGKSSGDKNSRRVEEQHRKPLKIKRTYGRNSIQGLLRAPRGHADDSASDSSCSSAASSGLANGSEELTCPSRKPASCPEVMGEGPSSNRRKGKDAVAKKKQRMEDKKPSKEAKGIKQSVAVEQSQSSERAMEVGEQKRKGSAIKKGPSSHISGSQEETWNLQIADKGRVTCPNCKTVSRKTVEGLKKHMTNCKVVCAMTCNTNPFTCNHCGKQLKSSTGMKYHLMADHNNLPTPEDGNEADGQLVKEKLRKVLKRMGKLKCSKEGCSGSFTSVMGYLYHTRKCGKEEAELKKLLLNCRHCGKAYKSRAGLEYHLKSEHGPTPPKSDDEEPKPPAEPDPERTPSGRLKRTSAQVAVFHLQEIASEELLKEWPKRKVQQDLVPDDKKLKYARPGLPAFSQEVLRKWKNEVKLQRKVQCPNQGCDSVYTSVSGLKAHLGLCSRGDFEAGKYKCLICDKEFSSESGVKYHINSIHAQDWFIVSSKASKSFEKLLKGKSKGSSAQSCPAQSPSLRFTPGFKGWRDKKRSGLISVLRTKAGQEDGKRKQERREKDCYDFSSSDSNSSSSSGSGGSSSSDSEAEGPEAPRHDKWALKRPLARVDMAKRAKNTA
ncbi:zinc finger protein 512 isoform X1 [Anguilla anguilla]|uniref:zinc finger protein 512 isoform X1 n=1 Tax=Anguilla anguilla TaxID=7936 RepID=UPI0015AE4E83|nr:zinc finger protein 512 isoform X1 [Anguilla anguilla]XP_035276660.1 zinc finger protein 512 isoform X1 [Anguilla anguilla]